MQQQHQANHLRRLRQPQPWLPQANPSSRRSQRAHLQSPSQLRSSAVAGGALSGPLSTAHMEAGSTLRRDPRLMDLGFTTAAPLQV